MRLGNTHEARRAAIRCLLMWGYGVRAIKLLIKSYFRNDKVD